MVRHIVNLQLLHNKKTTIMTKVSCAMIPDLANELSTDLTSPSLPYEPQPVERHPRKQPPDEEQHEQVPQCILLRALIKKGKEKVVPKLQLQKS